MRATILSYKERGRRELAALLGGYLATAVIAALGRPPPAGALLVPVPSRAAAARARGGDHVRRLAVRAAAELSGHGIRATVLPVLRLSRAPRDAAGLTATERAANVRGAFVASHPGGRLPSWPLVLVDDLVTTGSTLADAVRALTAAGLAPDAAAVIAATIRRHTAGARRRVGKATVEDQLAGHDLAARHWSSGLLPPDGPEGAVRAGSPQLASSVTQGEEVSSPHRPGVGATPIVALRRCCRCWLGQRAIGLDADHR